MRNQKCDNWARNPNDELYKRGIAYIWLDRYGADLKSVHQIYKVGVTIFIDNQTVKKMKEKKPVVAYWNVKQKLGRDMYIEQCNSIVRTGLPRIV